MQIRRRNSILETKMKIACLSNLVLQMWIVPSNQIA
jgi:hypothetical protein